MESIQSLGLDSNRKIIMIQTEKLKFKLSIVVQEASQYEMFFFKNITHLKKKKKKKKKIEKGHHLYGLIIFFSYISFMFANTSDFFSYM